MSTLRKVKQHRLHNEGRATLTLGGIALVAIAALDYWLFYPEYPIAF